MNFTALAYFTTVLSQAQLTSGFSLNIIAEGTHSAHGITILNELRYPERTQNLIVIKFRTSLSKHSFRFALLCAHRVSFADRPALYCCLFAAQNRLSISIVSMDGGGIEQAAIFLCIACASNLFSFIPNVKKRLISGM